MLPWCGTACHPQTIGAARPAHDEPGIILRQALQRYEEIRRPRTSQVQVMSRGREVRNHLPDGAEQQRRDAEFAIGDPLRQSAWLYGHDLEAGLPSRA